MEVETTKDSQIKNGQNKVQKRARLFYLDFIRALSLILIIIYHFDCHLGFHNIKVKHYLFPIVPYYMYADIGVSFFIIISGAALMYTYQDDLKIKDYSIRRFKSVFPTFYVGYFFVFLYTFYINGSIIPLPKWRFLLTIIGMDGYLHLVVSGFYLVGEWFLGFIIILYILFPLLRKLLIRKPIVLMVIAAVLYIISVIGNGLGWNKSGIVDPLTRLPEFLFGMYFVYYIKKISPKQAVIALLASLALVYFTNRKYEILQTTLVGICLFLVFVFVSNYIHDNRIKNIVSFFSKYSWAGIIVNQQVMIYLMNHFSNRQLSMTDEYLLFILVFTVIMIIAMCIYTITKKIVRIFTRE